jgi:hypothetical protein
MDPIKTIGKTIGSLFKPVVISLHGKRPIPGTNKPAGNTNKRREKPTYAGMKKGGKKTKRNMRKRGTQKRR